MHCEDNRAAQFRQHAIALFFFRKEASQPLRGYVCLDRLRVETFARTGYRIRVDIGRKDLKLDVAVLVSDCLPAKHRERIGLLARTASGNPNAQRTIRRLPANELWNDLFRQKIEDCRIPKETCDIDQQIFCEKLKLVRVESQNFEIAGYAVRFDARHRHPPLDAALQRARFVKPEVMHGLCAKKIDDFRQPVAGHILWLCSVRGARECDAPGIFDQRCWNFRNWQHKVDRACRDRAVGHAIEAGFTGVLRDDEAAVLLHGFQPEAAISPCS